MIRVLHMIGSLNIGGSQSMVMNLYRSIDRTKIQFDFIVDHPDELYYADEIKKLGGKIFFLPSLNSTNIFQLKKEWNLFFQEHKEYKILHSHVRSYASIYIPIAKKNGLKTIIHSHSTSNGSGVKSLVKVLLQFPLRFEADYFFGCSKEAGQWLFGKKIVSSERYYMIQNAIDVSKYVMSEEIRLKYRELLGIRENTTVFMHVGRLHEAKNHIFLLDIFHDYFIKNPDSVLILVGDGEMRNSIESKIKELNIEDYVQLLGSRADVADLLKAADCFLFPSLWEGLPVTVVEAQASGLRCFVSNRVTKDVNVTKLVMNLPIDCGTEPWVNAILESDLSRVTVVNEIKEAGFDIVSSSEWITEFYRGIYNE